MFASGIPDQFWLDILNGVHQPEDEYRIALYLQADAPDANLSATVYSTDGELETKGGYTRGGKVLTGRTARHSGSGLGAYVDFDDVAWDKATLSADAAVIYNASKENKILTILGFGTHTSTNGEFLMKLPPPGPRAVITIG